MPERKLVLSKPQREVLENIDDLFRVMRGGYRHYLDLPRDRGGMTRVRESTIDALFDKGLIKTAGGTGRALRTQYDLTDKGKSVLEAQK